MDTKKDNIVMTVQMKSKDKDKTATTFRKVAAVISFI